MKGAVLSSRVEEVGLRFPDAVHEIRTLLQSYGIGAGTSAAVVALESGLTTNSRLRDDIASMLTVILAQEPELNTLELMGLLLAASAGEANLESLALDPQLQAAQSGIFQQLVPMRRQIRELPQEEPLEQAEEPALSLPVADVETADVEENPRLGRHSDWDSEEIEPVVTPVRTFVNETYARVFARAMAIAADEEPFVEEKEMEPSELLHSSAQEYEAPAQQASVLEQVSREASANRSVPGWALGICGVLVGLFVGLAVARFWTANGSVHEPATVSQQPQASPVMHHQNARRQKQVGIRHQPPSSALAPAEQPPQATSTSQARPDQDGADLVSGPKSHASARKDRISAFNHLPAAGEEEAPRSHVTANAERNAPGMPTAHPVNLGLASLAGSSRAGHIHLPAVTSGSAGVMAANLVTSPLPEYPADARAAGIQGEVVIEAVVGRDGRVVESRIVSGPLLLREAALGAVQRWQYRPYEVDGKPAEIATTARLQFRLHDE